MIALFALWACDVTPPASDPPEASGTLGTSAPGSPIGFPATAPRTPPAVPDDVIGGAEAALAQVTDGYRIACDLPFVIDSHTSVAPSGAPPVRFDVDGAAARGVVRRSQGSLRIQRRMPRSTTCGDPSSPFPCLEEELAVNSELMHVVGTLRWWDGTPERVATCRFEPLDEVPISGTVTLTDGRFPGEARVTLLSVGCAWVAMRPDGEFRGARIRGEPCRLLTTPAPTADDLLLTLDEGSPHHDLRIHVAGPGPIMPAPEMVSAEMWVDADLPPSARDPETRARPAPRADPSPITDALALPALSDEVRAELVRWREAEITP